MAVVEFSARDRATRPATFVAKAAISEHKSFRLPPSRIAELRMLFHDLESMMGAKSCNLEPNGPAGEPTTDRDSHLGDISVELSGAERWCALSTRQKSGLLKCYRTLTQIDKAAWWALWRAYGPRSPNMVATSDFSAELAPLAMLTGIVEERRVAMRDALIESRLERASKAAGLAHADMSDAFRACAWDRTSAAIRAGTDQEVTTASAFDIGLHVKETGDAAAKQAIRDQRKSFVSKVARQADRMLADASMVFQLMWWRS